MKRENKLPISRTKLNNFRRKISSILDQEMALRAQVKRLYESFTLDAEDSQMALRYVRQAYFEIQKLRIRKIVEERLEFHPFFGSSPMSSHNYQSLNDEEDLDEDDDNII